MYVLNIHMHNVTFITQNTYKIRILGTGYFCYSSELIIWRQLNIHHVSIEGGHYYTAPKRYSNKLDRNTYTSFSDTLGMFPMKKFDKWVSGKFGYQLFIISFPLWRCMFLFTSIKRLRRGVLFLISINTYLNLQTYASSRVTHKVMKSKRLIDRQSLS